jgi:hypothetical protein
VKLLFTRLVILATVSDMAGTQDDYNLGFIIPPEERTPLVEMLLRLIQTERENHQRIIQQMQRQIDALTEEVNRLKGLPDKPKRPRQPSSLNDPQGKPSENDPQGKPTEKKLPTGPDGKRAGSAKRSKTRQFTIHHTVPLEPPNLPDGAVYCGTRSFVVQDLRIEAYNTCYERNRYRLPDGSYLTAPLPAGVQGHFGPTLRAHVLYQHHHNQVTQPLLWEELREYGIDISTGQIDRLLTQGHDCFHAEKDSLLPAAREVSDYLQTDDTSAKHCGKAGHTLHIGNEFFASFTTTDTKSRVNFLKVLLAPFHEYTLNDDTLAYLKTHLVPVWVSELAAAATGQVFVDDQAWAAQLKTWKITNEQSQRLLTEAALWASMLQHELYTDVALISDDAKQFKVQGFLHGLCWVHSERHVAGLIPLTDAERTAHMRSRDDIWTFYQRLGQYRIMPTPAERVALDAEFDRIFLSTTGWLELDEALRKIYTRKEQLLLVLTHPEIPLHNNLSENDIRQYVKKRKISAGTRSDLGRRCRDTFLSLKTTCRKLGYRFWSYLRDRLQGDPDKPSLADLIRKQATASANTT